MAGQDERYDLNGINNEPVVPEGDPFHIFLEDEDIIFQSSIRRATFIGEHYMKGKVLGQGSYGKVKEVLDMRNLCRRAVKIMEHKRLRRIPNGQDNVRREISIMKKLDHPNIMKLIDVLDSKEKKKLVDPYFNEVLRTENVHWLHAVSPLNVNRLRREITSAMKSPPMIAREMLESSPQKRFAEWQAHRYFTQLAHGVSYLHSRRVVHKDIKPSNLLLTTDEQLKITDLGVAEVLELFAPDDSITTSQGSPAFQPPEIANGDDVFQGFKVDVWSCGVTLFNLVTGSYPYEGDNIYRLFENIVNGAYDIPEDLTDELRELIKGMLMHKAQDRFSVEDVMSSTWLRLSIPQTSPSVRIPALESTEDLLRQMTMRPQLESYVRELRGEEFTDQIALSHTYTQGEAPCEEPPGHGNMSTNNHMAVPNAVSMATPTGEEEPKGKRKNKSSCTVL